MASPFPKAEEFDGWHARFDDFDDGAGDFEPACEAFNPISPPSGPATGSFNGLHLKSKLAII